METEKNTDSELQFKPLSEGLGFHPFSEGLPYTSTTGSGAVAAGAPRFVHPERAPKTVIMPSRLTPTSIQTPTIARPAMPAAPQAMPPAFKKPSQTQTLTQITQPETAKPAEVEAVYGSSYVAKRVVAYLFDTLFHLLLFVGGIMAATAAFGGTLVQGSDWMILISLCFVFVHSFLMTIEEWTFKNTLGKQLLGLRLEGPRSAILIRAIAFPMSLVFLGFGVFWALFDAKHRCWHDLASNVQPTEF